MSTPREYGGVGRLARAVDDGIFKVERTLVTIAGLVMTISVFLDICFRAFSSPESQLAKKLVTAFGWFGGSTDRATYEVFRDQVSPAVLILLTFLAGGAVFGAANAARETPKSQWWGALYGVIAVGVAYGFVQFILSQPSWLVCMSLLVLGCVGFFADAVRRKDWLAAALAVVVAALGAKACTKLPQDYIWSQELSLILLAWMAFLGGSMATRVGKHIQVDALARIIPPTLRPWTRALGLAVTTLFAAYLTWLAYEHVFGPTGDYASGEVRPATGIPAWTIILAMVVSFGLMTLRLTAQTIDALLNPRAPTVSLDH